VRASPNSPSSPTSNGIQFGQLIEFYQHQDGVNWANRMILGDSLLVMASLAGKEGLKGKVQMIYLDPPYGIKFGSNWQVSTRKRDVKDGKAEDATRQPEQIRAFRDTWKLGIHSYLAYLRDRVVLTRELLTESGSVFVQIGMRNVHLVRCIWTKCLGARTSVPRSLSGKRVPLKWPWWQRNYDQLLWYAKDREQVKFREIFKEARPTSADTPFYDFVRQPTGDDRPLRSEEKRDPTSLSNGAKLFWQESPPFRMDSRIRSASPFGVPGTVFLTTTERSLENNAERPEQA